VNQSRLVWRSVTFLLEAKKTTENPSPNSAYTRFQVSRYLHFQAEVTDEPRKQMGIFYSLSPHRPHLYPHLPFC